MFLGTLAVCHPFRVTKKKSNYEMLLRRQGTILHALGYEPSELPIARHSAVIIIQKKQTAIPSGRKYRCLQKKGDYEESLKH